MNFESLEEICHASEPQFQMTVPYENPDGSPLDVIVSARLDAPSRTVEVAFESIDPATGQLPTGVFDGFLPPNHANQVGEGFVSFFVRNLPASVTGDRVEAEASIVFDVNEPIVTETYVNWIDSGAPESHVDALPEVVVSRTIPVSWSSSDDGSGAQTFDILVSDEGGPYTVWLDDTSKTAAEYVGQNGHTYRFYSTATDGVGHDERPPRTHDTETRVQLPNWQNPDDPLDVNHDGEVTPLDVLILINWINSHDKPDLPQPPAAPPPYLDTSGDNLVTPLDPLLIINELNGAGEGEGRGIRYSPSILSINTYKAATVTRQISPETAASWMHGEDDTLLLLPRVGEEERTRDLRIEPTVNDVTFEDLLDDLAEDVLDRWTV